MASTLIEMRDAVVAMMKAQGLVGSYDVRFKGSRSTGWVGKPGEGDDVEVVVTINPLPSIT